AAHRLPAGGPAERASSRSLNGLGPRRPAGHGPGGPRGRSPARGRQEVRPMLDVERCRRPRRRAPPALRALSGRHPPGRTALHGTMPLILGRAAAIFVGDQLTKRWALGHLDATHPVVVVPDLFHLVLVMNPGVAFGIFAGVPSRWRWVVTLFSLTALALLGSL